jgi:hypothetical protein
MGAYDLTVATVDDAFAYTGAYMVRPPVGPARPACELLQHSSLPVGSRPMGGYLPNTQVLILISPEQEHAIILGAIPSPLADKVTIAPGSMSARCRVGQFEDPMHYGIFFRPGSVVANFTSGRPADTLPGDWGSVNDLELAIWVGRLMACLRASDMAKVEAFWGDDLLRLVGYNMELFTAGAQEARLDDEGEYNEIYRATPFIWEGMGLAAPGAAVKDVGGKLEPGSEEAKYEPIQQDQLIIPRITRLRGYLGDLEREMVSAPPPGLTCETYGAKSNHIGLLELVKHISGAYSVRSAKEITFEKYILLPVPKELVAPEDPTGDGRKSGYKAADILGDGDQYQLPEFEWGADDAQVRAAQLYDYHAWFFNRYAVGGLAAHVKDWHLPNEQDLTALGNTAVYDKNLRFGHAFMAEMPSFGELVLDARPRHSARYYRSRSCFKLLDDGGVLLEDGWGAQILMSGGSIQLTCPGDVWARPGRSFVSWAPYDTILRSGNCVDVSAALGDVRLKANRNLQILGGNSGIGGILIESRSRGPSTAADYSKSGARVSGHGITLKAAESSIHAWGDSFYLGRNQNSTGRFVLDAGDSGTLYVRGANVQTRVTNLFTVLVADDNSPDRRAFSVDRQGALLSVPLLLGDSLVVMPTGSGASAGVFIGGPLVCYDLAMFKGSVYSNGGYFGRSGQYVAEMEDDLEFTPSREDVGKNVTSQVAGLNTMVQSSEDAATASDHVSPGNPDFQNRVGFSFRDTVLDLKLDQDSFVLYETRWQQVYRSSGSSVTWSEPVVMSPNGEETRPHPGEEGWSAYSAFRQVDNTQNYQGTKAKMRVTMTEQGSEAEAKTLQDAYLINVQE